MIDYLSVDDLLRVAEGVVDGQVMVRDLGLLASAAHRPQATVFGADAYPGLADKAAALMHSLARNHPLIDGNKRLAWAATRIFCLLNGEDPRYASVDEAEELVLSVARGEREVDDIADWLRRSWVKNTQE
ncbi:MAG: type II toxin-antitoxin system death-on-curing family toxin [Tetrasphaera jenkinsii]|jgi:death-on-curing protein|uniref:Death-on-curing family protein n=1 Tax=Nostocoides jenkinsii Ben 74 TaxID=1193518 RepID=A0A077M305_9MICO|nr:type II toxin-antitoxin system death-on-curing family toxin [Tetrasphaera jenkinsii]MCI1262615.1 type II toxin-antitoxin system death-on-curing family toxin [Tetrasphaera jenkinsii]CCI51531.1 Death-on-curing family protein [Tetrasphaera jenkinsii Ben 74]